MERKFRWESKHMDGGGEANLRSLSWLPSISARPSATSLVLPKGVKLALVSWHLLTPSFQGQSIPGDHVVLMPYHAEALFSS